MASLSRKSLARDHQKELAELHRGFSGSLTRLLFLAIIVIVILVTLAGARQGILRSDGEVDAARASLVSSGMAWTEGFSESQREYADWLRRRGTASEAVLFERASTALFRSAAAFISGFVSGEELSLLSRLYLSLHEGLLRLVFLVIAGWRLVMVAMLAGALLSLKGLRVYRKPDVLGQTGNGRLFFSGARVTIDNPTAQGAPSEQVTGLACPKMVPESAARNSAFTEVLKRAGALNNTNLALVRILLAYRDWPAYVAMPDEEELLAKAHAGAPLAENALGIIDRSLALQAEYITARDELSATALELGIPQREPLTKHPVDGEQEAVPLEAGAYLDQLSDALDRVLTPHMRLVLAELPPQLLATALLALEAGKVLAYGYEGGKWICKSNFPQLCARAVLHSLPEYGDEYDFDQRAAVRRALIYASRKSIFGPVRFPRDLTDDARTVRQWIEVLMAAPHELHAVADEVEMLGIVVEAQAGWNTVFFDGAVALDPDVVEEVYATRSNLFFMPVARVVRLMRRIVTRETLNRLEQLVAAVSQRQRLEALTREAGSEAKEESGRAPSYERVFPPFSHHELKLLGGDHELTPDELRDWSALRIVFNSYSWLARRVSERSVPESSIVFAVFEASPDVPGRNEHGLIGRAGMVPLRGTRLEERWGRAWQTRFTQVDNARMAETRPDYERLLRGMEEIGEEEGGDPAAVPA